MVSTRLWALGATLTLSSACTDPPDDTDPSTTTGPTVTTEVTATTIPLPGDSTTDVPVDTTSGSTTSSDGSSSGTTAGESSGSSGDTIGTVGTTAGEESTTTGEPAYDVEWCRLQYPPMVTVDVDEVFTVYVRFYVPGLTDQSTGNDPAAELVVEMGYGVDGSDPSTGVGAPWTYLPAGPNVGWDDAVEPNNDEYQGDLSIDTPGIYDYAARISGDGGMSWVYCDLDDLLTGGYTTDQAGHAEVGQI